MTFSESHLHLFSIQLQRLNKQAGLAHDGQLWQKSVLEEEEGKMGLGVR